TEVTYLALLACSRTNAIVSRSPIASMTPVVPPGMQMRSRVGQLSNVQVGTNPSPQSLGTGARDLATTWVVDCGSLARTCNGPVRSSCVRWGNMRNPTLEFDMTVFRCF